MCAHNSRGQIVSGYMQVVGKHACIKSADTGFVFSRIPMRGHQIPPARAAVARCWLSICLLFII